MYLFYFSSLDFRCRLLTRCAGQAFFKRIALHEKHSYDSDPFSSMLILSGCSISSPLSFSSKRYLWPIPFSCCPFLYFFYSQCINLVLCFFRNVFFFSIQQFYRGYFFRCSFPISRQQLQVKLCFLNLFIFSVFDIDGISFYLCYFRFLHCFGVSCVSLTLSALIYIYLLHYNYRYYNEIFFYL